VFSYPVIVSLSLGECSLIGSWGYNASNGVMHWPGAGFIIAGMENRVATLFRSTLIFFFFFCEGNCTPQATVLGASNCGCGTPVYGRTAPTLEIPQTIQYPFLFVILILYYLKVVVIIDCSHKNLP
jgi:hypothetical protein